MSQFNKDVFAAFPSVPWTKDYWETREKTDQESLPEGEEVFSSLEHGEFIFQLLWILILGNTELQGSAQQRIFQSYSSNLGAQMLETEHLKTWKE